MKPVHTSQMIPRLLAQVQAELPAAPAEGVWPTEVLLFTQLPYAAASELLAEALDRIRLGTAPGHRLILTEHPATFVCSSADATPDGAAATPSESNTLAPRLLLSEAMIAERGFTIEHDADADGIEYVGPGMLSGWLAVRPDHLELGERTVDAALAEVLQRTLAEFGVIGIKTIEDELTDRLSLTIGGQQVALIETVSESASGGAPLVLGRFVLHTNTEVENLALVQPGERALTLPVTTLAALGIEVERQDEVRETVLRLFEEIFRSPAVLPQRAGLRTAKPPWLKARIPFGPGTERVHEIIGEHKLHTVCESARCPNMGECWRQGTATFMINGNVCTRSCSFCAIFTGRPQPLDPDEPRRVAEAARTMALQYVVVTAVNRDERPDGGAPQFAETIRELRGMIPNVHIEVLIPDFRGNHAAQDVVFEARPEVLNHNLETVPRLYPFVRPQAVYERSLELITRAMAAGLTTKSGIMVGLGEEEPEVMQTLLDLRTAGCDIVTIGQYLRPSEKHHPVVRYVTPAEFVRYRQHGEQLGFTTVESGPLVRSSYHAHSSYRRHSDGNGQGYHEPQSGDDLARGDGA